MSVLNIAGPEYDFGSVVFVVIEECEHRRRGFDDHDLDNRLTALAREKLAKIKKAYDEFGGSAAYWESLQREVLDTAMPQYIEAARAMNALERSSFGVWRGGDPAARATLGIGGLVVGGLIGIHVSGVEALHPRAPSCENAEPARRRRDALPAERAPALHDDDRHPRVVLDVVAGHAQ
jgi:hypothetical protein